MLAAFPPSHPHLLPPVLLTYCVHAQNAMGKKKKGKKKKGTSVGGAAVAVPPRPSPKLSSLTSSAKTQDPSHPHFGVMRICERRRDHDLRRSNSRSHLSLDAYPIARMNTAVGIIEHVKDHLRSEGEHDEAYDWTIKTKTEEKLRVILQLKEEHDALFRPARIDACRVLPAGGWKVDATIWTDATLYEDEDELDVSLKILLTVTFREGARGRSMPPPMVRQKCAAEGGGHDEFVLMLPGGGSAGDIKTRWSAYASDGAIASTADVTAWCGEGFMCKRVRISEPDATCSWYAHPSSSTIEAQRSNGALLRSIDHEGLLADEKLIAHYCILWEMYHELKFGDTLMAMLPSSAKDLQSRGGTLRTQTSVTFVRILLTI